MLITSQLKAYLLQKCCPYSLEISEITLLFCCLPFGKQLSAKRVQECIFLWTSLNIKAVLAESSLCCLTKLWGIPNHTSILPGECPLCIWPSSEKHVEPMPIIGVRSRTKQGTRVLWSKQSWWIHDLFTNVFAIGSQWYTGLDAMPQHLKG